MQKKFTVKAEGAGPNNAWCFLAIPFNVAEVWGTRGRVAVKGTLNGFPFRTNIQPMEGRHLLTFNKQLQAGARAKAGDMVSVVMERDTEERIVEPPAELAKAFRKQQTGRDALEQTGLHPSQGIRAMDQRRQAGGDTPPARGESRHHDAGEEDDLMIGQVKGKSCVCW